jgi:tetratricopeptide (TPR) repeat protein
MCGDKSGGTTMKTQRHGGFSTKPFSVSLCLILAVILVGCATPAQKAARQQQRYDAAKALFDRTTKEFHLPSAEAQGAARDALLSQAAAGYEQLLRDYRDQPAWTSQALRSLGNVRASQGRTDDAIKIYRRVGVQYGAYDWEVLQAWKSAGDLLWDAGRHTEAREFYQHIVDRFDKEDAPSVYKIVVRASKRRLDEQP